MIRSSIQEAIKAAMKSRDSVRLEALRFVWSEMKNAEIDLKHELNDEEMSSLLAREVKRRREAIEQFKAGNRTDLVESEEPKLAVIEAYLPKQLSNEEVEAVVMRVITRGDTDFGAVMRTAMGELKGKADGKLVADTVKRLLATSSH